LAKKCAADVCPTCEYAAAVLYMWARYQRCIERILVILPIIFGGLATWSVLDDKFPYSKWITAGCALLAGLLPAIYKALKLDNHIETIVRAASEYTNLRDRFRQLAKLGPTKSAEEFQEAFDSLMRRLEDIRRLGLTRPERFFKRAQAKIKAGHYELEKSKAARDRKVIR
jgi:hypothetical protein